MTTNPYLNAALGAAYVAAVSLFMFYVPEQLPQPDTVIAPMLFLSTFVFSAAMMGYLFLTQPLLLAFKGQTAEGVALFLKTIVSFAAIVLVLAGVVLFAR